jgi:hypothetical protein
MLEFDFLCLVFLLVLTSNTRDYNYTFSFLFTSQTNISAIVNTFIFILQPRILGDEKNP